MSAFCSGQTLCYFDYAMNKDSENTASPWWSDSLRIARPNSVIRASGGDS